MLLDLPGQFGDGQRLFDADRAFGVLFEACLAVAYGPLVRGRLAGDQPVAQAAYGIDDHLLAVAADRVRRERDTRRVRVDQALDQHAHVAAAGPAVRALVHRDPVSEGRLDAGPDRLDQFRRADHVQDRLVLA